MRAVVGAGVCVCGGGGVGDDIPHQNGFRAGATGAIVNARNIWRTYSLHTICTAMSPHAKLKGTRNYVIMKAA